MFTVKEVSELSHVTVKTLHHYHRIGLLLPSRISEAGYRLYGTEALQRLQQILFYRELDFPLGRIKELLEETEDRLTILEEQRKLLLHQQERLATVINTLETSNMCMRKGENMDNRELFKGFGHAEQWQEALEEQNRYLKDTYGYEPAPVTEDDVPSMNEQAAEAAAFMGAMAGMLRTGISHMDTRVGAQISAHLGFLNRHGHSISPADFAGQTRFFLTDEFHLQMLENQQTGLAYYLAIAAEAHQTASEQ